MMDDAEIEEQTDLFSELFQGREDVVFVDIPHPHQEKIRPGSDLHDYVIGHLAGDGGIGIYPLEGGNRCKWICSDFDTAEAEKLAWQYAKGWEYYGIQAWVETSKSKGYHVWVFADDWMSGTIARRAGLWVHELAGVEAVELNPKQELLEEGGYGNTVRLPYPGGLSGDGRDNMRFLDANGLCRQTVYQQPAHHPLLFSDWVYQAHEMRTPVNQLQRLAAMWQPPVIERTPSTFDGDRKGGRSGSNDHIVAVFEGSEDVKKGERDLVFFTLASHLKGMGMDLDEAIEIVQDVWETQTEDNKSFPYRDALDKVHRVYRGESR
jgi:hypothetical protein